MTTQMYYVAWHDDSGNSFDWFIEAHDSDEAIRLWGDHVEYEDYMADGDRPTVWLVPALAGRSRVLPWDSSEGVEMAWRAEQ